MKKIILLSLILTSWGGCQTSPQFAQNQFEKFQLQKITEKGIQTVAITSTSGDWPNVEYKDLKPISISGKKIKFAILGDTGCRLKEAKHGGGYQDCHLPSEWPYVQAAQAIAAETYDFAIHTGDYHYREQCTDKKVCPVLTQSIGYGWPAWWDDFYGPSQPLFKKSPILFVRGNHEDCQRAFSGWGPLSVQDKKFQDKCDEIEPYQWIEFDDLVMINFDDSAFDDKHDMSAVDRQKWLQLLKQLEFRIGNLNAKKEIWFIAHKPVVAYVPSADDAEPNEISDNLYSLMKESGLLKQIDYFLAGHIHNQQVIASKEKPIQVIVGHTGTALSPFGRKIMSHLLTTTTENKYSFGYAIFERIGFKKWRWNFKNLKGQSELECLVRDAKVNCDFK
jgi:predicted phosphodiesterase